MVIVDQNLIVKTRNVAKRSVIRMRAEMNQKMILQRIYQKSRMMISTLLQGKGGHNDNPEVQSGLDGTETATHSGQLRGCR